MNSAVEEIKSRISIVDFIGQYLRLTKAGANWKGTCPFHNEKTPSFMVHEEKQIWHCFGCGKGGDIFGFLMEMESLDFKEALKVLAEKAGVELPKYGKGRKDEPENKQKIMEILELSSKFYETQLWKGTGKDKILGYLRGRGLKDECIKEFSLGYAPSGWRNLLTFLSGRGYKIEDIARTGLLVKKDTNSQQPTTNNQYYDRFRDRITFPITDLMGNVIGFSARVSPGGDESQAKYVNTPETPVYHKSKVLYGIDRAKKAIKDRDEAILVEGNTDVMAAHQAGAKNTVAVSGTALTPDQLDILKRYTQNIKMFFDMDSAGQNAALRSAELALEKGLNVYIVESAAGKDAAEIISRDEAVFTEAVKKARPAVEYFLEKISAGRDKNNPIEKKKIAAEALELVRHIGNEIERSHWLKTIAEELDVDFRILADDLNKMKDRGGSFIKKPSAENNLSSRERLELIREKIAGLMLAFPEVWKMMLGKYAAEPDFSSGRELEILFREGKNCDFRVEKFLEDLESDETREIFRKMSFESRYRFNEESGLDDFDSEKAVSAAENLAAELEKEAGRKKMKSLLGDIKKAEKEGNKEAVKILSGEFVKLSKDLKI